MKKNTGFALSLLFAAALLTAASARAGETLTVLVSIAGNAVAATEVLAKEFMDQNPGVTIDIETRVGGGEGDNLIKTRLATGTMADVFMYNSGSLLQALNPSSTLLPIDDLPNMALVDPMYRSTVTVGGKSYGVPFGSQLVGALFYNKKVYAELGLSIPHTWADFIANCEKIKAAGKVAVIQSYRTTWTSQLFVLGDFYNVQQLAPNFAADYTANKAKYATTPAALKGFEHQREVFDKGFLNRDFGAATYDDALYMLCMGEGAHYPILSHSISAMHANFPDELQADIGVFGIPGDNPNDHGITVFYPNAVYIAATTKKVDLAKKFVNFLASVKGAEMFMEFNGAQGPALIKGAQLPSNTAPCVYDMIPYIEAGKAAPALEFFTPVKGPALEHICIEVGSGMRSPLEAAQMYDEDVRKQAQQLRLPGW